MQKSSSEKNKLLTTAVIAAVLLLCLGSFFVFLKTQNNNTEKTGDIISNNKTIFISHQDTSLPDPSVSAKSAVLIEASSGSIIWSKNSDVRLPMASTTKIMTALVAIDNCDITKKVSVSPDAVGVEGSSIYLYPNEILTLEDLLYAMLLESANDAAAAIAIEVGGSIEGFAQMMNQKAIEIGLKDTNFDNPHGLDGETHYTTAYELAMIAKEAYSNETFKRIVSTYKKTIPLNETEGVRLLINHNKLLRSYDGATGIKTGFTKKSGRCLVSAAERDGLTFIAVTLNAPDDWNDHRCMLDYGFSLYESKVLCDVGSFTYIMPVTGGMYDSIMLENTQKITLTLPRYSSDIECRVELPQFAYAPISDGEDLGRLVFLLDGVEIAHSPIVAKGDVPSPQKKNIFERIFGK